jgi:threonine/homoserine/homoserine lactone efflux protein
MSFVYLPWGIVIGLIMAAPIGPVNIICLRRSLMKSPINGFTVGLGAAAADGLFGFIAAFGLASVTRLIEQYNGWVEIVGGVILLVIGINLWFSHPHMDNIQDTYNDRIKAATGTFLLTITNPMTVLGFGALFIGLGLGDMGQNYSNAGLISIGILLGSALWWGILCSSASRFSDKVLDYHLAIINKISAILILVFGSVALIKNTGLI